MVYIIGFHGDDYSVAIRALRFQNRNRGIKNSIYCTNILLLNPSPSSQYLFVHFYDTYEVRSIIDFISEIKNQNSSILNGHNA